MVNLSILIFLKNYLVIQIDHDLTWETFGIAAFKCLLQIQPPQMVFLWSLSLAKEMRIL